MFYVPIWLFHLLATLKIINRITKFPTAKSEERMVLPVSEVVKRVSKNDIPGHVKSLVLELCVNNDEGEDVEVPYVKYDLPVKRWLRLSLAPDTSPTQSLHSKDFYDVTP